MKQVLQNLKTGETIVAEVPAPKCGSKSILIETHFSLISPGTERMLLNFGKKNLIGKALDQPERVREVIAKVSVDGLAATIESVQHKLSDLLPMGYSNVGKVIYLSDYAKEKGFSIGDFVVSNGYHSEVVNVPCHLCVKLPESTDYSAYTLAILGAIALQGIRLADVKIGEKVAVFGTGLIGRLAIDILKAAGAEVFAIDINDDVLKIVSNKNVYTVNQSKEDCVQAILESTQGHGVDTVLITASSTSDKIVAQSAKMCRQRGKVVLVGVVGLKLNRADFYEKEISFQVACSYGPGRYDKSYEEGGNDYPYGFVRWTEERNIQAVVKLIKDQKICLEDYSKENIPFSKVLDLYEDISTQKISTNSIISYKIGNKEAEKKIDEYAHNKNLKSAHSANIDNSINVGFIGAGAYTSKILAKRAVKNNFSIIASTSRNGLSAWKLITKYNGDFCASDNTAVLNNEDIDLVFITTQHNSHSELVQSALKSQKSVWCEKPLCFSLSELEQIADTQRDVTKNLYVGFNRRYSKHIRAIKKETSRFMGPITLNYNINAGFIGHDHWVNDPKLGGGRFLGENCHFVDLAMYLLGVDIVEKQVTYSRSVEELKIPDNFQTSIKFRNGSIANINYFTGGSSRVPKEEMSLHFNGQSIIMKNFLKTIFFKNGIASKFRTFKQDKGLDLMLKRVFDKEKSKKIDDFRQSLHYKSMKTTIELNEIIVTG